jgi:membrane protein
MARRPLSSFPLPPRSPRRPPPLWRYWRFARQLNRAALRDIGRQSRRHRLPHRASELAYCTLLALLAGMLALLSAMGFIEAWRSPLQQLALDWRPLLPPAAQPLLPALAEGIIQNPSRPLFFISLLGAVGAAWGSLGGVVHTLDRIHGVPRHQTRPFWRAKLITLILILSTTGLLGLALGLILWVNVGLVSGADANPGLWPRAIALLWRLWGGGLAVGLITAAIALVYRLGPSRWPPGYPLIPGAVLVAMAIAAPLLLLRPYLTVFQNHWGYGLGVALVLGLLWLQAAAFMVLLGAQTNVTVGQRLAQRQRPPGSQPRVPPPVFESFTIRRSPRGGDRPWG